MTTAAILTAVYDGYDTVKPFLAQSIECEAICVTDDPTLEVDGWRVLYEPRDTHPNRSAKHPKMRPWTYTNARWSVWIDASFRITSHTFAEDVLQYAKPIAQFRHPDRDCIYDEAAISIGMAKYHGHPIDAQMKRYRVDGHPERWGLWATGVIAREHTLEVMKFGDEWLAEVHEWSFQDQLSEAPLLRRHHLRPTDLPGWHGMNSWLRYEGSQRHY